LRGEHRRRQLLGLEGVGVVIMACSEVLKGGQRFIETSSFLECDAALEFCIRGQ